MNWRYRLERAAQGVLGRYSVDSVPQQNLPIRPVSIEDSGHRPVLSVFHCLRSPFVLSRPQRAPRRARSADRVIPRTGGITTTLTRGFNRAPVTCNISCMATPQENSSVSNRVRNYRKRMRAQGMRPIQIWVADVRSPDFAAEAHRQAAAVAASDHAADDQAFIDAISIDDK